MKIIYLKISKIKLQTLDQYCLTLVHLLIAFLATKQGLEIGILKLVVGKNVVICVVCKTLYLVSFQWCLFDCVLLLMANTYLLELPSDYSFQENDNLLSIRLKEGGRGFETR